MTLNGKQVVVLTHDTVTTQQLNIIQAALNLISEDTNDQRIILDEACNRVRLIQLVRTACPGLGLKEAKDAVDVYHNLTKEKP